MRDCMNESLGRIFDVFVSLAGTSLLALTLLLSSLRSLREVRHLFGRARPCPQDVFRLVIQSLDGRMVVGLQVKGQVVSLARL